MDSKNFLENFCEIFVCRVHEEYFSAAKKIKFSGMFGGVNFR